MFCTNCGGPIKCLEEVKEGINQERRYYGFCESCKMKVEIPEKEIHAENANGRLQKMEETVLKGANKLDLWVGRAKDTGVAWWKNKQMCQRDLAVPLSIQFGHVQLGIGQNTEMRQMSDGSVYFGYERDRRYKLVSYSWEGSEFQTVSDSVQTGRTKYRERNKMKGRGLATGAGAIIGTAIMPGIGTVVGAAVGAAGPRRGKSRGRGVEKVKSSQVTGQVEKDTLAYLTIQDIETEEMYKIMFLCNRRVDGMLNCLNWDMALE